MVESKKVIDVYSKRLSKNWEIINRTSEGIQVRKIKSFSRLSFWLGLILLPFWGIGLIVWLFGAIDYAQRKEKIKFVSLDEMVEQLKASR